jgi:hypothetical protein
LRRNVILNREEKSTSDLRILRLDRRPKSTLRRCNGANAYQTLIPSAPMESGSSTVELMNRGFSIQCDSIPGHRSSGMLTCKGDHNGKALRDGMVEFDETWILKDVQLNHQSFRL